MRKLILFVLAACPSRSGLHDAPRAAPADPVAAARRPPPQQPPLDAPPARPAATDIAPLPLAGPYPSLAASCSALPPCGFTDMDAQGNETRPATKPRCEAVLDPRIDIVAHVPDSVSKTGGATAMTHKITGGEIRIGGAICDVPKGLRREHSNYYVFVKRADGWWRTESPMFEYDYNDKYCGGGLYIAWNDKPTRTIAGIAAAGGCLTCGKLGEEDTTVELMLRVETTGPKPAVFPFLPVGERQRTEMVFGEAPPDRASSPECKPSHSATSLKETWPADDEVVLDGPSVSVSAAGVLMLHSVVGTVTQPGRYRFKR